MYWMVGDVGLFDEVFYFVFVGYGWVDVVFEFEVDQVVDDFLVFVFEVLC